MSVRRIAKPMQEPYCWNCGSDPRGRQLVTITEAAQYCKVSINAVYRWMERGLIDWVYNAGGKRRIYKDSLIRSPHTDPPVQEALQQQPMKSAGEAE